MEKKKKKKLVKESGRSYTLKTTRALFALSGNKCAFSNCSHELINSKGLFVAQICHIRAESKGGPRFHASLSIESRQSNSNLILLCYRHHREIDSDVKKYSVTFLKDLKKSHESKYAPLNFNLEDFTLKEIIKENETLWKKVKIEYKLKKKNNENILDLDFTKNEKKLFGQINEKIDWFFSFCNEMVIFNNNLRDRVDDFALSVGADPNKIEAIPYYNHPFWGKFWEKGNIGARNTFSLLKIYLLQIEILYLMEVVKSNKKNIDYKKRLQVKTKEFIEIIKNSNYSD